MTGLTPFYRTSNKLEHHFLNSSIGNSTRTPYFSLRMIEHWTSNIVQPITTIFRRYWIWQVLKRSIHKKILYVTVKAQISVIMGFEQLQEVERRTIDFHCFICQFWYNDIIIITNHVGLYNLHLGSKVLGIGPSIVVHSKLLLELLRPNV